MLKGTSLGFGVGVVVGAELMPVGASEVLGKLVEGSTVGSTLAVGRCEGTSAGAVVLGCAVGGLLGMALGGPLGLGELSAAGLDGTLVGFRETVCDGLTVGLAAGGKEGVKVGSTLG